MRSILISSLIAVIILAVSLAPTPNPAGAGNGIVEVPGGEPIQIAVVADVSGPVSELGDGARNATEMAIDDFGPISGFDVQQNNLDGGCFPDAGPIAAQQVVDNVQNVGVIGHVCTGGFHASLPIYQGANVVTITGSATGGNLAAEGTAIFNRTIVDDTALDEWIAQVEDLQTYTDWSAGYETRFGGPPPDFAALFYDAATLMLTRIDEVSTIGPGGELLIGRDDLASAVRNTTDFMGVTCLITLDEQGSRDPDPDDLSSCATELPAKGDVDCNGSANSIDTLQILRLSAGFSVIQEPDCPELGAPIPGAGAAPAGENGPIFGDMDCDADVDAVDGLFILKFVAGLPVNLPAECPPIGE